MLKSHYAKWLFKLPIFRELYDKELKYPQYDLSIELMHQESIFNLYASQYVGHDFDFDEFIQATFHRFSHLDMDYMWSGNHESYEVPQYEVLIALMGWITKWTIFSHQAILPPSKKSTDLIKIMSEVSGAKWKGLSTIY